MKYNSSSLVVCHLWGITDHPVKKMMVKNYPLTTTLLPMKT
jgi:hypothetical protein